jgi:hypothetical protein
MGGNAFDRWPGRGPISTTERKTKPLLLMNKAGSRAGWMLVEGTADPLRFAPVRITNSSDPKD